LSRLDQQLRLPDERMLGYDEYGSSSGLPLFYFHGSPSSRVEWPLFVGDGLAQALGLRVIAPDRPGLGLSGFQDGRRIGHWSSDVLSLADRLGLQRFAILGYSGGGPYALACAQAIPERLTRVGVISGTGPFDRPGLVDGIPQTNQKYFFLARYKPWLSRLMFRGLGFTARFFGQKMAANAMAVLPEADCQVMALPEFASGFLRLIREALRQGPRGAQRDVALMVSPWEFRPQDITMPVRFWHGEEDVNAPPAMGRYLAAAAPDGQIQFYPGEGHLSLFVKHAEEILGYFLD